jgi:hypothetical protein
MHTRGIILEGYSNAGKTSTLKALKLLQAQGEELERSVVILSEHYTQICNRVNGDIKFLNRDEHLKLLQDQVQMIKNLNDWSTSLGLDSREPRGLFFIFERFHLNHRAAFSNYPSEDIMAIENRLYKLGAKCVLLTLSPNIVEERVKSRRPQEWLSKPRGELLRACNNLLETQDIMREQSKLSRIPTIEMITDDKDWNRYAKTILELF